MGTLTDALKGIEVPRGNAVYYREIVRNPVVTGFAHGWRPAWGARGRRFESSRPDQ